MHQAGRADDGRRRLPKRPLSACARPASGGRLLTRAGRVAELLVAVVFGIQGNTRVLKFLKRLSTRPWEEEREAQDEQERDSTSTKGQQLEF